MELVFEEPPKGIRVAWVLGDETIDRYCSIIQPQAVGLLDELVSLVVLCPQGGGTGNLPCPPIEVIRYADMRWPGLHPNRLAELARELASHKVQLLHALDSSAINLTNRLAELAKLNYVVTCRSLGDSGRLNIHKVRPLGYLAATSEIQRELTTLQVAPPNHIYLARPGVYQEKQSNCFNQPGRSVAILAGGSLDCFEDFHVVLKSFAEILKLKRDCAFFIMGDGSAERQLRHACQTLGLQRHLTFVEHQSAWRMSELLQAADVYVSPSPDARYDVGALLAMAAGVPVVAANNPGADFLLDGKTVLLYSRGNSQNLAEKLLSLMDDHALANALAQRALDYLHIHHSPARMVVTLADIYRQTLAAKHS